MLEDNATVRCTSYASGIDEFAFTQGEELTTNEAEETGPGKEAEVESQESRTEVTEAITNYRADD